MSLVTLLSTAGMALGLAGIVPQIVRMVSARSAGGAEPGRLGHGARGEHGDGAT